MIGQWCIPLRTVADGLNGSVCVVGLVVVEFETALFSLPFRTTVNVERGTAPTETVLRFPGLCRQ